MGWIEDNELRPEVQKLVDRFGQAQTFDILMALAHSVCPGGANKISGSLCAWKAVSGSSMAAHYRKIGRF